MSFNFLCFLFGFVRRSPEVSSSYKLGLSMSIPVSTQGFSEDYVGEKEEPGK